MWQNLEIYFIEILIDTILIHILAAFHRSSGFSIYTYSNENSFDDHRHLIYHNKLENGCPSVIQNITVNNVTQGIMFINERTLEYTSHCTNDSILYVGIELCEVKVMGMYVCDFFL